MKKIKFRTTEEVYTLGDLPRLKEENIHLRNTVIEMVELGVINGDYDKEVLLDDDFLDRYLLDELNNGCINTN